jgi:tetratricopeptide (TPR) repeat protein
MRAITRLRFGLALLCLLACRPLPATDNAAQPPAWTDALHAIAEIDLEGLDPGDRDAIREARIRLNTALQNHADPAELANAYGELGVLYHVHNVFQPADTCYENARQLVPGDFRWAYYSAYLAAKTGRTRLALERFKEARRLRPGYHATTLRMGDAWLDLNEQDKARQAYQAIVDAEGLQAAALYGLGQIALLQREYDSAIDYFRRALKHDPDASRIHYPLAQALRAVNRNAEAKNELALRGDVMPAIKDPQVESLEAIKGGAGIHFLHAMQAINRHDNDTAREEFAAGLALAPDNVTARISYARVLYLTGDKTGARRELEAALARQADNPLALFLLGVLTEEEGDGARAAEHYREALEHDPGHAGANFYLANRYYRQGRHSQAAEHYAAAIEADPKNIAAYMPQLATLLQTGATDADLMPLLMAAIKQFPEHAVFHTMQVRLLATSTDAKIKDPREALRIARQLVEQQDIPPHQEVLALALAASGDFEQAAAIQEELLTFAIWSAQGGSIDLERLNRTLAAYRAGKLPSQEDMAAWPVSRPPAFHAVAPFRDYPTVKPY